MTRARELQVLEYLDPPSSAIRAKAKLASGKVVFVKLGYGGVAAVRARRRSESRRERLALARLRRLAVPRLVPLPRQDCLELVGNEPYWGIGTEWIEGVDCFNQDLPLVEALALWLFVVEQLCAFHRRGIIHLDVKPQNILRSRDGEKAWIVDFDTSQSVAKHYYTNKIGSTRAFAAPEFNFREVVSERTFVYPVGMLLGHLLCPSFQNARLSPASIRFVRRRLSTKAHGGLAEIFLRCIAEPERQRYASYAAVYVAIEKLRLGDDLLSRWERLRAPYRRTLAALGLEGPEVHKRRRAHARA